MQREIYHRYGTRKIQILIVFDIAFNKKEKVLIKERLHVLLFTIDEYYFSL